jgi:hypothetical protein
MLLRLFVSTQIEEQAEDRFEVAIGDVCNVRTPLSE